MIRARGMQEIQFIMVVQGLGGEAAAEPPPSLPNPPYTRKRVGSTPASLGCRQGEAS